MFRHLILFFHFTHLALFCFAQDKQPISIADIEKKAGTLDLGYTLINKRTGEELFPPQKNWVIYDQISDAISGNLIRVESNSGSLYGYIDINGKVVVPIKYRMLTRFYKGVAIAQAGAGSGPITLKYGVINTKGEVVVPFQYESINAYNSTDLSSPFVSARLAKNKAGVLDITTGKHVLPFHFSWIFSFSSNGFVYLTDTLGKNMICNLQGKPVYIKQNPQTFEIDYKTAPGKILIRNEEKPGYLYLDTAGQAIAQTGEDFEFMKKLMEAKLNLVEKLEVGKDVYFQIFANGKQKMLTDPSFKPIVIEEGFNPKLKAREISDIPEALEVQVLKYRAEPFSYLIKNHKLLISKSFNRFHYPAQIETFPGLIYGEESGSYQVFTHQGSEFIPGKFYYLEPVNNEGRWLLAAFNDTLPSLYTSDGKRLEDKNLARGVQLSLLEKIGQEKWYISRINNTFPQFSFPVSIIQKKKKQVLEIDGKEVFSAEASLAYRKTDSIFVFVNGAENRFYKLGDKGFFREGYISLIGDGKFGLTQSLAPDSKFALFDGWMRQLTDYAYTGFSFVGSNILTAKKETGWALLNASYQPITPFVYSTIYAFHNNFGAAECINPKSIQFLKRDGTVMASLANAASFLKIRVDGGTYLKGCDTPDSTLVINHFSGEVKKTKKPPKTTGYDGGAGRAQATCWKCSGSGTLLAWVGDPCGRCGGSGGDAYKCLDCNGKGAVAETKVLSAQYYGSMNYAQAITQTKAKECRSCRGKGLKGLCYSCDGKGVQNARKEEVKCGQCNGTGKTY